MEQTKIIYETGATSHAVNDLILFTDNTRSLVELRDSIYQKWVDKKEIPTSLYMNELLQAAKYAYNKEFSHSPESYRHINTMTMEQQLEYLDIYANDFENWKLDHSIK